MTWPKSDKLMKCTTSNNSLLWKNSQETSWKKPWMLKRNWISISFHCNQTQKCNTSKTGQFLANIIANIEQRLFATASTTTRNQRAAGENRAQYSDLLQIFEVLDPADWHEGMDKCSSETQIKQLAQQFHLDSRSETEGFWDYKEKKKVVPHGLQPHIHIMIIPVSSAECE